MPERQTVHPETAGLPGPGGPTALREFGTPRLLELAEDACLVDAVGVHAERSPDAVVFSRRVDGNWVPVTAKAFATEVAGLAAGLVARGVQAGDRVALMSRTRYEWTLCDYAIWTAGAVTVPVYETSSAEQVQWNLSDSGAVLAILETATHRQTYDAVAADLPLVTGVVEIDGGGLEELAGAGRDVPAEVLGERRAGLRADSLATIIYTSGTTGRPKGCELTHATMMRTARTAGSVLPELLNPDGSTLLFLPLAHVFARLIQVACVEAGVRMGHTADVKNLLADLGTFRPTFILAVPRVFEKVYNTARQRAHAEGKGRIWDAAERTAIAYSRALDAGRPGVFLRVQHALFDRLVYSRLRTAMGGRVAWAVSGGAPLGARLGHFFRGIGLTILEGWGLSETTAAGTVNTPAHLRVGSVGRPFPGVTLRIASDGEILMSGDTVYRGYWHNEAATAECVKDGWFHTGDIGRLDEDGFLSITGRKKEIIVTAGGKNVAPAVLEDRLRAHPLVSQCLVVGDKQPYIACLITLDQESLDPWLAARGQAGETAADVVQHPSLMAELQTAVDEANRAVSKAEAIRRFRVLAADWTEETGHLTPSLKLKRSVVMAEFAADIEALYPGTRD